MASEPGKPPVDDKQKQTEVSASIPPSQVQNEDSDPDFDDLDDVLDQFSSNAPSSSHPPAVSEKPSSSSPPQSSGPGRPPVDYDALIPDGQREGESEEDFMKRLTAELSTAMSRMASGVPDDAAKATPEDLAKMGKDLEEFTLAMEKEGIQPEDLLKAILGEEEGAKLAAAAQEDAENNSPSQQQSSSSPTRSRTKSPTTTSKSPSASAAPTSAASFESTIRATMERMSSSSAAATSATQTNQTPSEEDMLADLLKSLGPGADGSSQNPDDLSNMFLSMMQQLTSKSLLYEPMKDLDGKFPGWLSKNRSSLKRADLERYEKQQVIVKEIVGKFEERTYNDDNQKDRDFIWEKMQAMQEQGAPPEELVEGGGGIPGMGGLGDLMGGGDAKGLDEGCPTQ